MPGSASTDKSSTSSLWAPQGGALTSAFNNAQNVYNTASQATTPTDFTAQFDPSQLATFRQMLGYAGSSGIPSATAGAGASAANSGLQGINGALTGLAGYDPTTQNNTGSLIDSANRYVAGQNIDGQVNDAMLSARQQARDVTMPGIEQNAATSGNTNSSRTGIADGLVQRGLAEQATNLGATLRNNAFSNGLSLASSNANANNAAALSALTARLNGGNAAFNSGVNASGQSITDAGNLFNMANAGGAGLTAARQADLTNQNQRYQNQQTGGFTPLQQLMSIIGTQNWAPSSTEHSESTPSTWQVIGGLLGGAGNLASGAGGLGWKPFG